MFFRKKEQEQMVREQYDISGISQQLQFIDEKSKNYGTTDEKMYLDGDNDLEQEINRLLELKNSQIRTLFLFNAQMIEFVTQMDYVKDMIDWINEQKVAINDVAAGSEELSSSSEEISNYVQNSLERTKGAVEHSTASLRHIEESFTYFERTTNHLYAIQKQMEQVVSGMKAVEKVVNIINEVADQTNLLSLNASIEAARSGEAGRGFAVVASEIKKLSQNTKDSVEEIQRIIENLQVEIHQSSSAIDETVQIFTDGKKRIANTITSINEMKDALQLINESFANISANVEEEAAVTEELTGKLVALQEQTEKLFTACMKTGRGIYSLSHMLEECRQTALPYFKDFRGGEAFIPSLSEHLLLKWKVHNMYCGFVELRPEDIKDYRECTLGQYLNRADIDESLKVLIEPHKKMHTLAREAIRALNNKQKQLAEQYMEELNQVTEEFAEKVEQFYKN